MFFIFTVGTIIYSGFTAPENIIWWLVLWPILALVVMLGVGVIAKNPKYRILAIIGMGGILLIFGFVAFKEKSRISDLNNKRMDYFEKGLKLVDYDVYLPKGYQKYDEGSKDNIITLTSSPQEFAGITTLQYTMPASRGYLTLKEYNKQKIVDQSSGCGVPLPLPTGPLQPCEEIITTPKGIKVYGHNIASDSSAHLNYWYYFDIGNTRISFQQPVHYAGYGGAKNEDVKVFKDSKFSTFVDSFEKVDIREFAPAPAPEQN